MFFFLAIKQLFLTVVCIVYMSVSDCRWKLLGTAMGRLVALSFFLCLTWSKASGITFIYVSKIFYTVFNPITWSQKHLFRPLSFIISNGEILTAEPWLICLRWSAQRRSIHNLLYRWRLQVQTFWFRPELKSFWQRAHSIATETVRLQRRGVLDRVCF